MDGQANSVALPREPGAMGAGNRTGIRKDRLAPSIGCSIFVHEELIAQRNIGVCLHVKCRGVTRLPVLFNASDLRDTLVPYFKAGV